MRTAVSVSGDIANLSHNIEDMAESFINLISLEKFKDNSELSNKTFKIIPAQGEDIFEPIKKNKRKNRSRFNKSNKSIENTPN